jgi:hypothetical protein
VAQLSTLGVAPRFMKPLYAFLILLAFTTVLFATEFISYDNAKPPSLSMPAGYELAAAALGSATNQFHCISASISTDFGIPGWFFTYCSTNTPPKYKWVTVEFGGKVHVEDILLR